MGDRRLALPGAGPRRRCWPPGSSTWATRQIIGRAVAALASDAEVARWNGAVVVAAALAEHYGFADVDGRHPRPLTFADV